MKNRQSAYYIRMDEAEKALIKETISQFNGNKSKAANYLGLNRTTLVEKCRKHGIPLKYTFSKGAPNE